MKCFDKQTPPIQWVLSALLLGVKWPWSEATYHLHLELEGRMSDPVANKASTLYLHVDIYMLYQLY